MKNSNIENKFNKLTAHWLIHKVGYEREERTRVNESTLVLFIVHNVSQRTPYRKKLYNDIKTKQKENWKHLKECRK